MVVVDDVPVAIMWSSLLPSVVVEVAWPKRAVTRAFDNDSDGREDGGGKEQCLPLLICCSAFYGRTCSYLAKTFPFECRNIM